MRFVDGEQRDRHLRHLFEEAFRQQALRRDIQQLQIAGEHAPFDVALRERIETRIQERRFDAELAQRGDLILHQRDQRRNHDRRAFAQQRGDLVAQRFSAAGRHQHERVAAARDVPDDGFLISPKGRVTEYAAQHVHGVVHCSILTNRVAGSVRFRSAVL